MSPEAIEFARAYVKTSPKGRRQVSHYVFAFEARMKRNWPAWAYHWLAFFLVDPKIALKHSPAHRRALAIVAGLVLLVLLVGCGGDTGGGGLDGLRPVGQAVESTPSAAPLPAYPTSTPQIHEVEVTRIVPFAQTQVVTVEREVVVVITAMPEIVGFDMSEPAIDESVQPCPAPFWRGGRCTATAAQIEAYAKESK